jgi:hypothetical protein
MTYTYLRFGCTLSVLLLSLLLAGEALAQQPSQDQIAAIRSSCRADYQAKCAGVQPGGPEALACLKKNIATLSPPCQKAVGSVGGAASQKSSDAVPAQSPAAAATSAPAPAAGGAAMGAMPAGQPPVPPRMALAMLRQACGADYRANCAGVPPGGGQVISCLAANQARLSPGCQRALAAAK